MSVMSKVGTVVAFLFRRKTIPISHQEFTEPEIAAQPDEHKPKVSENGGSGRTRKKQKNPEIPQMKFPSRPSLGMEVFYRRTTKKFLGPGRARVAEIVHKNGGAKATLRPQHQNDKTVFFRELLELRCVPPEEAVGDRS